MSRPAPLATALLLPAAMAVLIAFGCGPSSPPAETPSARSGPSGLNASKPTTSVTLPDGAAITAELALTDQDRAQGMMFRSNLRPEEGMLFPFADTAPRGFWMFQCLIALDIIWMDDAKRVVELSPHTPPCSSGDPRECPSFGGSAPSTYVLELAAGQIALHGIEIGDQLNF